jgi:hypothetical protein
MEYLPQPYKEKISMNDTKLDIEEVYSRLEKFNGLSYPEVDVSTLHGKVVSGYQGWFNTPEDGAGRNWVSWDRNGRMKPGSCTIDLWPDTSELDADEKYATNFLHKDGSTAYVYSAYHKKTVLRHFKWMKDYGIDGAFVQRFVRPLTDPVSLNHINKVLSHCRDGANLYGRSYNVMYDLSGMDSSGVQTVMTDWKYLVDHMGITKDPGDKAYQYHNGKPVVTLWGIGFNDGRKYTLQDCMKLVDFFKNDEDYGNNTVMLGVPTGWREQSLEHYYIPRVKARHLVMDGDCLQDSYLHEIIKAADIVSPWTVDRYSNDEGIEYIAKHIWSKDIQWCDENGVEFMPVVFPGFSWSNLYSGEQYNQIPRRKGKFLWKQYYEAINVGATMIYQAMYDEVNEGTAIFKCSDNPPVGESKFVDYEGLGSDFYLRLVGSAGKMLRNEIALTDQIPL